MIWNNPLMKFEGSGWKIDWYIECLLSSPTFAMNFLYVSDSSMALTWKIGNYNSYNESVLRELLLQSQPNSMPFPSHSPWSLIKSLLLQKQIWYHNKNVFIYILNLSKVIQKNQTKFGTKWHSVEMKNVLHLMMMNRRISD